jgi:hypothetical protein
MELLVLLAIAFAVVGALLFVGLRTGAGRH